MGRVVILGNSGSGKSTLARAIAARDGSAVLDLDLVAWQPDRPGERAPLAASRAAIERFAAAAAHWVIEGSYASLAGIAAPLATEFLFLHPGVDACLENCRRRPWEPHKYPTRAAQEANLPMLLEWVGRYETRDDEYGFAAHQALFDQHAGPKRLLRSNREAQAYVGRES